MTSPQKEKTETKSDAKKSSNSKKKKDTPKRATKKSKEDSSESPKEPEQEQRIMKKRATAKEIDKTQAKRLVKPVQTKPKKTRKVVKAVKPTKEPRDIGVEVALPIESCFDPLCPFHGKLSVRGQIINGIVVSSKMDKTAIIQKEIKRFIPKYERYEKRTHRYAVHNPPCLNVQRGDLVKIMECRPLSKSKSFVVIEKL